MRSKLQTLPHTIVGLPLVQSDPTRTATVGGRDRPPNQNNGIDYQLSGFPPFLEVSVNPYYVLNSRVYATPPVRSVLRIS